ARRVTGNSKESFSRLIIRIAIVAVALSMTVMVVSTALIAGFKEEISTKIFGFWGHVHITDSGATFSLLENFNYPIDKDQEFYSTLDKIGQVPYVALREFWGKEYEKEGITKGGIRHIQQFAVMPGLVKSYPKEKGDDIEMEGIILKGIA
ncbi:MAG: ABC transporter permease, partial [Bacteroidota bacterium]